MTLQVGKLVFKSDGEIEIEIGHGDHTAEITGLNVILSGIGIARDTSCSSPLPCFDLSALRRRNAEAMSRILNRDVFNRGVA